MPRIVIENGPDRGRSFLIRTESAFFAGRDPAAQVPIRDEMASRRHFQIDYRDGRYHLRDLESKNGVFLNSKKLEGVAMLVANDRIQVGDTLLTFVGDAPHPLLGREVAGYRIEDRIGRGGMGTVYRALQLSLDRTVALKILAPHLVENQNFINLFIREARAAGALSHPNLVQVYDVGVEDDIYFYSMEYIPHGSVEDQLNLDGPIPLPRTLEIIRDAALGLQYAELKGLVHRDIKPGNLMVGHESIIKIGDLGIARFGEAEGRVSQKDGVSGSPHYIAPEQARGRDIDHRADIYALGVSFYQMLCGSTPYRGSTPREVILAHINEEPPPLIERAPEVPGPVVELVEAMMRRERDQRIASSTAVLERLEPLLRRYRESNGAVPVTRSGRKGLMIIGGLLLIGAVASAGTVGYMRIQREKEKEVERIAGITDLLERAEADRAADRRDGVARAIDQLAERGPLPDELAERRDGLEAWLEESRSADELAARERREREAFESTESRAAELAAAEALALWETFLTEFPDSSLAERARAERDRIAGEIRTRAERERAAGLRLRPILSGARTLAKTGDFRRALEQLQAPELENAYIGTQADLERLAEIARIEDAARDSFDGTEEEIGALLDEGRFREARLRLDRYRDLDFLTARLADAESRIGGREEAGRDGTDPTTPGDDPVAAGLAAAWRIWARGATDGDGGLRTALDVLRDFELRSTLEPAASAALDRHLDLLRRLPEVLDAIGTRVPEGAPRIDLRLADGSSLRIVPTEFDREWVRGRAVGGPEGKTELLRWSELEPASRIAALRAAELPQEEFAIIGLFVAANGDQALAEEVWKFADVSDRTLIGELRAYLARVARLPEAPTSD